MIFQGKILPIESTDVPTGHLGLFAGPSNYFYVKDDTGSMYPLYGLTGPSGTFTSGTQSITVDNGRITAIDKFNPVVVDNSNYTLIRYYDGYGESDFTIRLIVKQSTTFSSLELLPAGLSIAMTLDDIRYVCYNPTNDGLNKKYTLSVTFNKLISDSPFVLGGDSYINQLHLYDNIGDIYTSGFSYTSIGGTGQYTIPLIKNTGFNISGTINEDPSFTTGGYLEMVFKGSLIGKI